MATHGSDVILLMVTGVTLVIVTLRLMARAYRMKQQAVERQAPVTVTRATPGSTEHRPRTTTLQRATARTEA
jgi:Na+-transporting methylmalonyl-CoA/oxaloacetate decarboxylase gamma subunit